MNQNGFHSKGVIEIRNLSRSFGRKKALDQVSLTVPEGSVFGLMGVNGAGKTTLIRHVLGLLRAESGAVHVFDRDPVQDPVYVLGQIGHLAEENDLPGWMRVEELFRYTQAFFPSWDPKLAEELRRSFGLDPAARLRTLSKGQRARAGLITALAHRPKLLVLDEPSSGLDPVIRRDIMGAIVRTIAEEGRTVLFSSHLLDEVERVCDHIALIHEGRIILSAGLDDVKERHRRLTWRFEHARSKPPELPGALVWEGRGYEWTALCDGSIGTLQTAAAKEGGQLVEEHTPSLDEIFVARVGSNNLAAVEA